MSSGVEIQRVETKSRVCHVGYNAGMGLKGLKQRVVYIMWVIRRGWDLRG